jgi:hypothetical protein
MKDVRIHEISVATSCFGGGFVGSDSDFDSRGAQFDLQQVQGHHDEIVQWIADSGETGREQA